MLLSLGGSIQASLKPLFPGKCPTGTTWTLPLRSPQTDQWSSPIFPNTPLVPPSPRAARVGFRAHPLMVRRVASR
ncbi:hypothetical protein VTI28DRAFT_9640 [Corynascus sepedonium]